MSNHPSYETNYSISIFQEVSSSLLQNWKQVSFAGKPYEKLLQKSSQDEMNASTRQSARLI